MDRVTVTYPDASAPVLRDVSLDVPEGELALVVGRTGSGKSTLLRCLNGLVPHFTGGHFAGTVVVGGRDTRTNRPRDLADVVGFVGQDPVAGFVTDTVEDELAYGMETLGVPPPTMRRRVEETLDLLGLDDIRDRPLLSLSAGQQQRVAIGSVMTPHPRVLVLDEPTSALDPAAADEVLAALTRLVHDLGMTVVMAEHRLERVVQYADRVIHVPGDGGAVDSGAPADVLARTPVGPPVVELARIVGWSPLPLSVREARRGAADLRARLADLTPRPRPAPDGVPVVELRDVSASYGDVPALRGVTLTVRRGAIVAVMGRNGAGKSTLLSVCAGLRRSSGDVRVADPRPTASRARSSVGSDSFRATRSTSSGRKPSGPSVPRPTATRPRRPGPRAGCSTGSRRTSPTTGTRATCRRDSGSRWLSPSSSWCNRPSSRSTSRPEGWTTSRSDSLCRSCETSRPEDTR